MGQAGVYILLVVAFGFGCYRFGYDVGAADTKALARKKDINLPMGHCQ